MDILYSDMHQYNRGLFNLRKALEMSLKSLSDSETNITINYFNIERMYVKT